MATNLELQTELKEMMEWGVEVLACKACSDRYGVSKILEDLGISVIQMGQPPTHYLKSGLHVISF